MVGRKESGGLMKTSVLREIQETVIKYADIMSKIAGVDVEVVDENLFRVAGTGMFRSQVSQDMSGEAYVYRHVLATGRPQVIYSPGEAAMCQNCPKKGKCGRDRDLYAHTPGNEDHRGYRTCWKHSSAEEDDPGR